MCSTGRVKIVLTWTPKVCKIMAFWANFGGVRPLLQTLGVQVLGPSNVGGSINRAGYDPDHRDAQQGEPQFFETPM